MRAVVISAFLVASLASAAWAQEVLHKTFDAPLKPHKKAQLKLELGAATLHLDGEAPAGKLFTAEVEHSSGVVPVASVRGGKVQIGTEGETKLGRRSKNDWTVHLARAVEWSLDIEVGAAKGVIDLSGLKVRELEVAAGAAQLEVGWKKPNGVPLEVARISGGAARIGVFGLGWADVDELVVEGGAGTFDLDFGGPQKGKTRVKIETGAGAVDLDVPRAIGIRVVEKDVALAKVEFPDDLGSGSRPETANYATAKGRIDVSISAAIGRVRIRRI